MLRNIINKNNKFATIVNHYGDYFAIPLFDTKSKFFGYFLRYDLEKEPIRVLSIYVDFDVKKVFEQRNKLVLFSDDKYIDFELDNGLRINHNLEYLDIYLDFMNRYNFEPFGKELKIKDHSFEFNFNKKLVVKGEISKVEEIGWEKLIWDFDKKRGSEINEYWMYKVRTFEKNFYLNVYQIFDEKTYLINRENIKPNVPDISDVDYSLSKFFVKYKGTFLPFAGFWWFDQFWIRDFAYSFKAFKNKEMLKTVANEIISRGKLLNRIPETETLSFDGPLLIAKYCIKFGLEKEAKEIVDLFKNYTIDEELIIPDKVSWTDTKSRDAIEIHALWYEVNRMLFNKYSQEDIIKKVEEKMKNNFDYNIILAANFLPYLDVVFINYLDYIIENYSISNERFFAITTENVNSKNYKSIHTGENPESYHSGDAWLFLTNYFGLLIKKLMNQNKIDSHYSKYLEKIQNLNEKFWKDGIIFSLPEITDSTFEPKGSLMQLWSVATWKMLLYGIYD
ncbi:MAG: amylo-alpha-1,6-glucosidase [Candidatus Woesearchaeota archaeon]